MFLISVERSQSHFEDFTTFHAKSDDYQSLLKCRNRTHRYRAGASAPAPSRGLGEGAGEYFAIVLEGTKRALNKHPHIRQIGCILDEFIAKFDDLFRDRRITH